MAPHNFSSLVSNKTADIPGSTLAYQSVSQAVSSTVASSSSAHMDMPVPLLASSGQLLQNAPSMLSSSQSMQTPLQMSSKDFKAVESKTRVVEPLLPDPPSRALPENNEPILPLPKQTPQKVHQHFYTRVVLYKKIFSFFFSNPAHYVYNHLYIFGHVISFTFVAGN